MADREIKVGIVGAGRLGVSLAAALARAGYPVAAVSTRDTATAQIAAAAVGPRIRAATPAQVVRECDPVFLTVPDGAIADVAAALQWRPGQWVVHCSGVLGLEPLAAAASAGAATGTLHPLQSFPSREPEPERFRGVVCGIEGASALGRFLHEAVLAVGARPVRLEGVDRALYHAAAVMVNNHAIALVAAATRIWETAGLPATEARAAFAPLMRAAADNVADRELARALTGPVARGDLATVERHLAALEPFPELRELYRRLALELARLPLRHDPATIEALRRLLEAPE